MTPTTAIEILSEAITELVNLGGPGNPVVKRMAELRHAIWDLMDEDTDFEEIQ